MPASEKRKRDALMTTRPAVVNGRAPYLSEKWPLSGPATRNPKSNGSIANPAWSGESPSTSCR